jgi:hypothetical protein
MFTVDRLFSDKDHDAFAKAWNEAAPGRLTLLPDDKPGETTPESRARETLADIADGKLRRPTLEKLKDAASRSIQDQAVGGIGRR